MTLGGHRGALPLEASSRNIFRGRSNSAYTFALQGPLSDNYSAHHSKITRHQGVLFSGLHWRPISNNSETVHARPNPFSASRAFALIPLLVTALTKPLAAQPFEGCPSKEILAAFNDFASVGKPPTATWRAWLRDPKAQYVEPWKAFDDVHYVGVLLGVSLGDPTSNSVVLIDTLREPHVDQLIANLGKVGINLSDINMC